MPNFRYRALTQSGEVVAGSISAPTAIEVDRRIEYLGLLPIEAVAEEKRAPSAGFSLSLLNKPRSEDVTTFTRDLALMLGAGARLDAALELLSSDVDTGRMRSIIAKIRASVLGGKSFAESVSEHPSVFPPMYEALVRVGEHSGNLDQVLDVLATERGRSEQLRGKLTEALQYPAFVLFAAGCVLTFFLLFVLPQFATVLHGFGAKLDPIVAFFLFLSDTLRAHGTAVLAALLGFVTLLWLIFRRASARQALMRGIARLPLVATVVMFHTTALFCRNLSVLIGNGMPMSSTLRILVDIMQRSGHPAEWPRVLEGVRQGGKLSDALTETNALPSMAVRMLRIGEEAGRLPVLAARIAEFYQTKLERSLDRIIGIVGPASIILISVVVGGLIVSVMTSLLSVNQLIQ